MPNESIDWIERPHVQIYVTGLWGNESDVATRVFEGMNFLLKDKHGQPTFDSITGISQVVCRLGQEYPSLITTVFGTKRVPVSTSDGEPVSE